MRRIVKTFYGHAVPPGHFDFRLRAWLSLAALVPMREYIRGGLLYLVWDYSDLADAGPVDSRTINGLSRTVQPLDMCRRG